MALVGLSDLEPEFGQKIRTYEEDIKALSTEVEILRKLFNDVKGLSKTEITQEFQKVRDENRRQGKEIVDYC